MKTTVSNRSYEQLTNETLLKLASIAQEDRLEFFQRNPKWCSLYQDRILCVALCQGAALHYVDGENGVKDFDIWTFYKKINGHPFPYRRIGHKDFGHSKFGVHPDFTHCKGRVVDLIGRSIPFQSYESIIQTLQNYLVKGNTESAKMLNQKAVVIIEPIIYLGKIVWYKGTFSD